MIHLPVREREAVLRDYVRGALSFAELASQLRDYVVFSEVRSDEFTEFRAAMPRPLDVSIPLTPAVLRPVLQAYLRGELDDAALERWATVLLMLDAFDNPSELSDEEADDLMDPMWDGLWYLSANPGGGSRRGRVETLLADLAELEVRLGARPG